MSTVPLTRDQIERAGDLDFDKPRQELTMTVKARVNGFDVDICFSGRLDQLDAITKRLQALGAEPVSASPKKSQVSHSQAKAETVTPIYQPDGTACCPVHQKPLTEGTYGLYCSAKAKPGDAQNAKGYCSIKFAE